MFSFTTRALRPLAARTTLQIPRTFCTSAAVVKPTVDQIKQLRARTMAGPVDCRKALEANNLDIELAVKWLQQKGMAQKPDRNTNVSAEGVVLAGVNADRTRGILFEMNSETDFVARNELFQRLSSGIMRRVLALPPATTSVEGSEISIGDVIEKFELGAEEIVENPVATNVALRMQFLRNQFGEKIVLRRAHELNVSQSEGGIIGSYIHSGGKYASLVAVQVDKNNSSNVDQDRVNHVVQKLATHIVGFSPRFIQQSDATDKDIELYKEKNLLPGQKFDRESFVRENSLLDQEFVGIADEKTVREVLADPELNGGVAGIKVTKFIRWERGN